MSECFIYEYDQLKGCLLGGCWSFGEDWVAVTEDWVSVTEDWVAVTEDWVAGTEDWVAGTSILSIKNKNL